MADPDTLSVRMATAADAMIRPRWVARPCDRRSSFGSLLTLSLPLDKLLQNEADNYWMATERGARADDSTNARVGYWSYCNPSMMGKSLQVPTYGSIGGIVLTLSSSMRSPSYVAKHDGPTPGPAFHRIKKRVGFAIR